MDNYNMHKYFGTVETASSSNIRENTLQRSLLNSFKSIEEIY